MKLHTFANRFDRAQYLKESAGLHIDAIEKVFLDDETQVHCENLIGAVSIPLGLAGPLPLHGENIKGEFYIPLATTEGALVASVNRGCKAIRESGSVSVSADKIGTTRGPVFYTATLAEQKKLTQWIKNNEANIKKEAESTSNHLTYKKVKIRSVGCYTYVRFYFDTEDAMGMNMATIASQKVVEQIERATGASCLAVAGNFDVDKKPAWLNFIDNRGFVVRAEIIIAKEVLHSVLKTTPKKLHDIWVSKCMIGSAMSGSMGFNAHYANIVAAFFAATGQDLAHVVEGSMGITTALVQEDCSLYFSIYMPAVMIATVGGGTKLKTQTEARKIINVKRSIELAEVLGAAVLAGELSLLSSIAEGTLARSHAKLGR